MFDNAIGRTKLWIAWVRGTPFSMSGPLERLCLLTPDDARAFDLAIAFRVYHTIKLSYLHDFSCLINRRDNVQLAAIANILAKAAFKAVVTA